MSQRLSRQASVGRHPVQSVVRATELLKVIGALGRPASLAELAATCGLERATAWRLLVTLEQSGFVERDSPTSGFRVGSAAVALVAGASGDFERLARLSRPQLEHLVLGTGLTAGVSAVRGGRIHILDQVDPPSVVAVNWVGKEFPLHTSSPGKVFLASLPAEELERVLLAPLERLTRKTITSTSTLRAELDRVRESQVAVSDEEFEDGCVGISSGIESMGGDLVAILSLTGPSFRMARGRRPALSALVRDAAVQATKSLGIR